MFLTAKSMGLADFNTQRSRVYDDNTASDSRDKAFGIFHETWFVRLGLRELFENVIAEFPIVANSGAEIFIKRVWMAREEGSQLYKDGFEATVMLALQPARVMECGFLQSFLRHELLHISDMLDTRFQYSPHAVLGGDSEITDNLIRDRFRLLWNWFVDGRLQRRGYTLAQSLEKQRAMLDKAFFFWSAEKRENALATLAMAEHCTQAQLLALARDKESGP